MSARRVWSMTAAACGLLMAWTVSPAIPGAAAEPPVGEAVPPRMAMVQGTEVPAERRAPGQVLVSQ